MTSLHNLTSLLENIQWNLSNQTTGWLHNQSISKLVSIMPFSPPSKETSFFGTISKVPNGSEVPLYVSTMLASENEMISLSSFCFWMRCPLFELGFKGSHVTYRKAPEWIFSLRSLHPVILPCGCLICLHTAENLGGGGSLLRFLGGSCSD